MDLGDTHRTRLVPRLTLMPYDGLHIPFNDQLTTLDGEKEACDPPCVMQPILLFYYPKLKTKLYFPAPTPEAVSSTS